jgi:hypothetical protein
MIGHFLKRDFKDSLTSWIILSFLSVLFLIFYTLSRSESLIFGLGYLFFMFSIFQIANLMGNIVRTDHIISRQYYLALPAKRNTLFFILLIRIFIFNIPLFIYLTLIAPITLRESFAGYLTSTFSYFTYFYGVLTGLIWFISTGLLQALIMERSLHHSSSRKRMLSAIIPTLVSGLGFIVVISAIHFALKTSGGLAFFFLLIPAALVAMSVRMAKSRWTSVY